MTPPGLVVAAAASGSGKTLVTLGLSRALHRRGLAVACFKSGPDYIDPAFLAAATGRPAYNLDSWAMPAALAGAVVATAADADLVVAEGSMGLFDGVAVPGAWGTGATADLSARTGWPVMLVVDPAGQAQTAAAAARGLAGFRADVRIAGAILNRVASPRHEALVRAGFAEAGIPVFGALPRSAGIAVPERHLGLVQAGETADLERLITAAADLVAAHVDLDAVVAATTADRDVNGCFKTDFPTSPKLAGALPRAVATTGFPTGGRLPRAPAGRIALASDVAFSFVYPHLLAGWRADGATILPFSPLADEAPDPGAELCWLPGGYPELHAGRLAAAERFRAGLVAFAETRPVHGECGGYMALGAGLVDAAGERHRMAGLLGLETSFARRRMTLGYRRATLLAPIPGHDAGARLRGHEFHYATILAEPDAPLARLVDATGADMPETGSRRGRVTGSFLHLIAAEG
ncbi:cobyrinate a,c-diamide synthase [Oharaeibacter diazotrophicus]|uniref:Hydrogenobyrinate a,c-diamide synthase n=1 Tax=Oharaeibacter diazotrophicus TaxID=1920512 RepID=A0A4R6RH67_9HYPH|nr:cobyrinate a,c-diamide synthase [Oharaeibacter diazotrophicus]TDP85495.1 hydrogenobyrinic acid a,c-diamide synthase (glutamine-hydrolysing) /cobyrinate a,c-diamide synthase [Oharaeibacter diazotrophicus]BBE74465.1 cobyrinic acid A,C-diamide synthase [Pleomorphomonas sp. SM30]GLS75839.1 hydrogenobyrinate a,c-diamide synthase [Oharaeibacter diazotrophicus]